VYCIVLFFFSLKVFCGLNTLLTMPVIFK
jgi:hypothetical protein